MRIAIVEDEVKLARVLQGYLVREGFTVTHHEDGARALEALVTDPPDLVLLDLMLPGLDGMSVCRGFRRTSNVPVIMMTARVEEIDRLLGLEIGADDYVCKPFSPREVVARVKAVLRRTRIDPESGVSSASAVSASADTRFRLDPDTASAFIDGQAVELTLIELRLLGVLSERPGHIFNRTQLMARIYDDHRVVSDRTVDSDVKKLRQKLRTVSGETEYVHSVYGIGYKFELPERT